MVLRALHRWLVVIALFVAMLLPAAAQTEKDSKMTVRGSCAVPHPLTNGAFKKSLTGIYDANLSLNYRPFSTFYVGIAANNGLFKTAANKIAEVNTALQVNGLGGRIAYDHFFSETVFFSPSITAGRQTGKFTGVVCLKDQETQLTFKANYIEPELNLYFIVDPGFAIGINTSFKLSDHTFDPYAVCFNQYKGYKPAELQGNSLTFNIGFGFYYGFWGGVKRGE